jgi:hypothetical protein
VKLANYTTSVQTSKSISEIYDMLGAVGASAVTTEFELGEPAGISFRVQRNERVVSFRMPCDWRATLRVMERQKMPTRFKRGDHARRVSWRILRDWMRAQLALLEIENASVEQLFLPYVVTSTGETFYERVSTQDDMLLLVEENK